MKRILTLAILLLSTKLLFAQQDVQQSQYMFNGIYINPAYAGYKQSLNLHSFYRSQWTGMPGGPVSMSLAVDATANDGNVGLALQVASDKLGAQNFLSAYANYAYRLRMNADGSSRLAFGLGIGLLQSGINGNLLNTNDPEVYQPVGNQSQLMPDGRIGVYYSDNKYYAGLSADNLIAQFIDVKASNSYLAQPKPHYYLTAGMLVPLSEDVMVKPSVLLKDDRGGPTSLDVNAFLLFGQKLWLGASYRTGVKLYSKDYLQRDLSNLNSVVGAVELFPLENLRVGYAYDFSIGPLKGYSSGTHELSVGFYFRTAKTRMLTPRYF
ncbi:type IX secretion system membrane protein PorP/SprF [Mucilaginibacter sp. Bleaf8]|uniref:PorP/SprF family type IX secretion system membrane protein n=1 Tax=Mucilaginibacter sp. Bleaf8 TaxID=2834430 RepID=UPI001BCCA88C|nr:type IX secretion system membrane protein PorP/SprF [Mucilaginibacter sp. Bleaf8]MBS7564430.1 type IX secretion system membrane protein PorP/SprF [Mucilaginibacter sp. Bleaf8]